MPIALTETVDHARPLHLVTKSGLAEALGRFPGDLFPGAAAWAEAQGFTGDSGATLVLPGTGGAAAVLVGLGDGVGPHGREDLETWALGHLPDSLPAGTYRLAEEPDAAAATRLALGWALGAYAFTRYKARKKPPAQLVWPQAADRDRVTLIADAMAFGRDLINTPAGDLGPKELAEEAAALAKSFGARCAITVGDDLLTENYPAIHAVGRAADNKPRLIDLRWGGSGPAVTLVGKGVCFDSGGLDIKSSGNMLMMKKDMGGGATVLAVARMIMAAGLKVRLRVLVPAVENAISGNAFHPWDILATRKGVTVEVGNTDAEGRLILCDALAEADREKPDLLIDCATLTGAARVALGPELPVIFTRHDDLAARLQEIGRRVADPVWRLPLWPGYRRLLDSKTADLSSTGESSFNGAITAALYLAEFVSPDTRWVHVDMMAWNTRTRPGRPEGGEVQTARTLFALVESLVSSPAA